MQGEVLVKVALSLFAEHGYAAVSTDTLLKQSRISKGLFMYHFHDKPGLMQEIISQQIPFLKLSWTFLTHCQRGIETPDEKLAKIFD